MRDREPTLFDRQPPFQLHSDTSRAAAESIVKDMGRLERAVYAAIRGQGRRGLTDAEGQVATGICVSTYVPRRVALVEQGLVRDSEQRRMTDTRRLAVVWVAIEENR